MADTGVIHKGDKINVGETLTVTNDFQLSSEDGKHTVQVKSGDTGFVDSEGVVHYLTGEARGHLQAVYGKEDMKGYDAISIAIMIKDRLNEEFGLTMFLEDKDIKESEFVAMMSDELMNILKG